MLVLLGVALSLTQMAPIRIMGYLLSQTGNCAMKNLNGAQSDAEVLGQLAELKAAKGPSAMLYVVQPSTASAIDVVYDDSGVARLGYSKALLQDYLQANPGHCVMDAESLQVLTLEKHRLPVQEISEEDFMYALEVLPPLDYQITGGYSSFKLSEFYTADLTSIYVRDPEGRCFSFRDQAKTSAAECVAKVQAYKKSESPASKKPSSPGL